MQNKQQLHCCEANICTNDEGIILKIRMKSVPLINIMVAGSPVQLLFKYPLLKALSD